MLKRLDTQNWSDKESVYRDSYFREAEKGIDIRTQTRYNKFWPNYNHARSEILTNTGWKNLYQIPPTEVIGDLQAIEKRLLKMTKQLLNLDNEEF